MSQIIIFLIGAIVGGGAVWHAMEKKILDTKGELKRLEIEKEVNEKIGSKFEQYTEELQKKKEERKDRILEELDQKIQIQNNDVAELLNVSRTTAYNYLEELENEGKIKQVGETGRNVIYKRV